MNTRGRMLRLLSLLESKPLGSGSYLAPKADQQTVVRTTKFMHPAHKGWWGGIADMLQQARGSTERWFEKNGDPSEFGSDEHFRDPADRKSD